MCFWMAHTRHYAMAELTPPDPIWPELYPWTRSLASIHKLDIIRPKYPVEQLAAISRISAVHARQQ